MDACRTLKEYAVYVEQIRTYARQMPLAEAMEKAVDKCIAEGLDLGERRLTRINGLNSILIDLGRLDDLKRATQDRE